MVYYFPVPLDDLGVHQNKAPPFGQSSHWWAIKPGQKFLYNYSLIHDSAHSIIYTFVYQGKKREHFYDKQKKWYSDNTDTMLWKN